MPVGSSFIMRKGRIAGWVFIVVSVSLLTDGDGFTILATRLRTAWAFGYGIEVKAVVIACQRKSNRLRYR